MAYMDIANHRLFWQRDTEKILIEPWGRDGLRVRVTHRADFDRDRDWALLPQPAVSTGVQTEIFETAPDNFAQDAARLGQGEYHVAEKPQKSPTRCGSAMVRSRLKSTGTAIFRFIISMVRC